MRVTRNFVWGILAQATFVVFQFLCILHQSEESLLDSSEEFYLDYGESIEPEVEAEWVFTKGLFSKTNNKNEDSNQRLPDEVFDMSN